MSKNNEKSNAQPPKKDNKKKKEEEDLVTYTKIPILLILCLVWGRCPVEGKIGSSCRTPPRLQPRNFKDSSQWLSRRSQISYYFSDQRSKVLEVFEASLSRGQRSLQYCSKFWIQSIHLLIQTSLNFIRNLSQTSCLFYLWLWVIPRTLKVLASLCKVLLHCSHVV